MPRPVRSGVFIGFEGKSEQSFYRYLAEAAQSAGKAVYVIPCDLKGYGSSKVKRCAQKYRTKKRELGSNLIAAFLVVDRDNFPDLDDAEAHDRVLADIGGEEPGLRICFSVPFIEGTLLRLTPTNESRRPSDCPDAERRLRSALGSYSRPESQQRLTKLLPDPIGPQISRAAPHDPALAQIAAALCLLPSAEP